MFVHTLRTDRNVLTNQVFVTINSEALHGQNFYLCMIIFYHFCYRQIHIIAPNFEVALAVLCKI